MAPLPRDSSLLDRCLYALLRAFLTTRNVAAAISHINSILSTNNLMESVPDSSLRLSDLDPPETLRSTTRFWSLHIDDCLFENVSLRAISPDVHLDPSQSTITSDICITGIITASMSLRVEVGNTTINLKATLVLRSFRGCINIVLGAPVDNVLYSHNTVGCADAFLYDIAKTEEYSCIKDMLPHAGAPTCEILLQAFESPDIDVTLILDPNHPILAVAARALFIKQAGELFIRWNLRRLLRSFRVRLGT